MLLTKNAGTDKYSHFGWYGIGFDTHGTFSFSVDSGFGKNVVIFGVDTSSSICADNRKKRYINSWSGLDDKI